MGEVDMKKVFLFLTIILVTCCFYSCGKNEKNEQGTYIPLKMYETVKETKSYYEGIKATYDAKFYTVLCVKEDGIYSNVKFHDAYKLNPSEIDFTFSSKNTAVCALAQTAAFIWRTQTCLLFPPQGLEPPSPMPFFRCG